MFTYFDFTFVCRDPSESQRRVAMISEMIHSASLIHDDVIDQSNFRRGKPSVNVLWNHRKVISNLINWLNLNQINLNICETTAFADRAVEAMNKK